MTTQDVEAIFNFRLQLNSSDWTSPESLKGRITHWVEAWVHEPATTTTYDPKAERARSSRPAAVNNASPLGLL